MQSKSEVQLSKKLSYLLRHGAEKEGLQMQADGFISVSEILKHRNYASDYNLQILQKIVANDKKQRYCLRQNDQSGEYEIRANQGHSLKSVQAEECLQIIVKAEEVPLAIHGTYKRHWKSICERGLRCMTRNHIHFATNDKMMKNLSGFRSDSELLIYLNVEKAMQEGGMQLFRSANDVILCAGINGCIPKEYFAKVLDRRTGATLDY